MAESIGMKLRMLRFSINLTQNQVSEATGLMVRTISNYENDKFDKPRVSTLQKLADYYRVSLDEITIFEKSTQ